MLLAGVCVWGVVGRMDTTVPAVALVQGGDMTLYLKEEQLDQVESGMAVRVKEAEYAIASVADSPIALLPGTDEYALHLGGMQVGEWVVMASADCDGLADGVYAAVVGVESIAPMSFILN